MRFVRRNSSRCLVYLVSACLAACVLAALPLDVAHAQAIVMSVNGEPITSVDIEQQMKLLRVLRRPATRDAAIESMIEDRLKSREASRFGINIKDNEIGEEVQLIAKRMKVAPGALTQAIARAGVSDQHAAGHFKAQLGYSILVRALNRGVEASEVAVRNELAKDTGGGITNYTIRQIVFTLNPDAPPAEIEANVKKAQALKTKFTSCQSGIAYAKTLPGVAVRPALTRSSEQLSDGIRDVLDKTPIGHLTDPSRSGNGIELIALCERSASRNNEDRRKAIADRLLAQHYEQQVVEKYKEMRSHAVISRNP